MKKTYRIKQAIHALARIIVNPKNLFYVLNNEDYFEERVRKEYGIREWGCKTIQFDDLNIPFPETITTYSFLGGTSSITDLILLKGLAKRIEKCRYFEIGTWRGESIINLQEVVSVSVTLNLSKEELIRTGGNDNVVEAQNYYIREDDKIIKYEGNSSTFDFSSLKEKFDLIFIDGDHHWKNIKQDTENVFRHLTHDHSIVVWHDYKINYSTIWWEVLYGIMQGVTSEVHERLYHIRNTNCLVYLPFSIKAVDEKNPFLPASRFSVTVEKFEA